MHVAGLCSIIRHNRQSQNCCMKIWIFPLIFCRFLFLLSPITSSQFVSMIIFECWYTTKKSSYLQHTLFSCTACNSEEYYLKMILLIKSSDSVILSTNMTTVELSLIRSTNIRFILPFDASMHIVHINIYIRILDLWARCIIQ